MKKLIDFSKTNSTQEPICFLNMAVHSNFFSSFDGAIVIKGNQIIDIGEADTVKAKFKDKSNFIDCRGYVVTPGFINSHSHCAMGFFRDLAHNKKNIIEDLFFPVESKLNLEITEPLSYSYIYSGLRSGVTCFVDHYYFSSSVAKALKKFGLKGVVGETTADLGGAFPSNSLWQKVKQQLEGWTFGPDIIPAVCPHAMDTVSENLLKGMADFAKANNLPLHMHLSQTKNEYNKIKSQHKISPVKLADNCGAITENALLVHLLHVEDEDLNILSDRGATIGFCPASQIIYEQLAPIAKFKQKQIPIALGTDCAGSNDTSDILAEMRLAALLFQDRIKRQVDFDDIFNMVTTIPAQVLGLKQQGDLKKGYFADLVFLKQELDTLPVTHLLTNLIFSQGTQNVEHVMVNGEWVLFKKQPVKVPLEECKFEYLQAIVNQIEKV